MKKRAAAKKPTARKGAAKKQSKTRGSKSAKTAKSSRSSRPAKPAGARDGAGAGKYTPTPIQGIGWAPFRYPL